MIFMYDDDRIYLIRYLDPHGEVREEEYQAEDYLEALEMLERGWIPSAELTILDVYKKINGSWDIQDEYDGQPDEAQEWHDYDPDC
jgi:hypothetical protein